jgi:hypothetical protein
MRVKCARVLRILSFLLVLSFSSLRFLNLCLIFCPRRFSSFFLCICILSNFSRAIANIGFLLAILASDRLCSLSWSTIHFSNDMQGGIVIGVSENFPVDLSTKNAPRQCRQSLILKLIKILEKVFSRVRVKASWQTLLSGHAGIPTLFFFWGISSICSNGKIPRRFAQRITTGLTCVIL